MENCVIAIGSYLRDLDVKAPLKFVFNFVLRSRACGKLNSEYKAEKVSKRDGKEIDMFLPQRLSYVKLEAAILKSEMIAKSKFRLISDREIKNLVQVQGF